MSSLLQGYVTGRCFNQTTVKIFILVCNPWGHRLRPEFLSCTTYLWHLPKNFVFWLSSWKIGEIRSSRGVCMKYVGADVISWICLFPHSLGQERTCVVTTVRLFTEYGRIKLLFWNNLSCIRHAMSRKEEMAHVSTQIILQDTGMAPVLTFVIFSIPTMSHDFWSDYQNQVQELWGRPQGT